MRLRRDIAFAESFFVVRDFAVGHRTPMDPALLAVAEYRDRCAEKLDEIEQMQADDLDVESLIAQWRLQAAAADIRALSVRDEILLLAGSALACCSVASAVLGYFAVMVIAGVLFAGITIYIRKFAKSVLVVGPDAPVTRLPLWAMQFIDVPSRARLVRLVNTRRI